MSKTNQAQEMNANHHEHKKDTLKPVDGSVPFNELPKEQQDLFVEAMKRSGMDPSIL